MFKLVRFKMKGHSLFEDDTLFSLQSVSQSTDRTRQRIIPISQGISLNKVIGIVGINATGKSTLIRIFKGLNDFYLNRLSIDQTSLNESFRSKKNQKIEIIADFVDSEGSKYRAVTTFFNEQNKIDETVREENEEGESFRQIDWCVEEETIYKRKIKSSDRIKNFFNFDEKDIIEVRSKLKENQKSLLSDKDSLFRVFNTTNHRTNSQMLSTVDITNSNVPLTFIDETPVELLRYLDSSIEFLKYQKNEKGENINYSLKFVHSSHVITVPKFEDLTKYLSSGTVKGITLFYEMFRSLSWGATLFIDEVELHINKQIVRDFIDFFSNPRINKNNATLIYSTHYIELVDDLERKDELYVLVRRGKSRVIRFSDDVKLRSELKTSEIFQRNRIRGTAPNYKRLTDLKKSVISHVRLREMFDITKSPKAKKGEDVE